MRAAFEAQGLEWPGGAAALAIVDLSLGVAMAAWCPVYQPISAARSLRAVKSRSSRCGKIPLNDELLFAGAVDTNEALDHCEDNVLGMATGRSRRHVAALLHPHEVARAAGVHAIGVGWEYHRPGALAIAGADRIVKHFNALEDELDALWEVRS